MYLSVHAAAGALIGSYVDQPVIACSLGVISHFILDMIPHHDADIPTKGHTAGSLHKLYFKKIVGLVYFDISVAIIIVAALLTNNIHLLSASIIWAVIGSTLPDVFQAAGFWFKKNRLLKLCNTIHNAVHYAPNHPISLFAGHATQLITLLLILKPLV